MTGTRTSVVWVVLLSVLVPVARGLAQPPSARPAVISLGTPVLPASPVPVPVPPPPPAPPMPPAPALTPPPAPAPVPPFPLSDMIGPRVGGCVEPGLFYLDAEYLLLRPRRRAQDFAIVGVNPNWAPLGEIHSIEGGYESGFRLGAGYRYPGEGWDVRFLYTYLHNSGDDQVAAQGRDRVFPTLTHPAFVTDVTGARAANSVNVNLFDLEVGRQLDSSGGLTTRLFAGPRVAILSQKFAANYTGGDVRLDELRRQLCFEGAGVRVGGEVDVRFLESLGMYVRGSASLMTGRFCSSLSETADGRSVVAIHERFDKVVPVLDLGIGLSYRRGGLRLSVGYEFQNWFGVVEGFDFTDDAHPAKMTRRTGDLGFDGFVFRAEWQF